MAEKVLFDPFPKQQEFITLVMEGEYSFILFGGAVRGGKLLRVDEPIPTPAGWSTMGALQVGDELFNADGKVCKVTWKSDIEQSPKAVEFTFDDGSTIESDVGHQWVTTTFKERGRLLKASESWRAKRKANRPRRGTGKKEWLGLRNSERATLIADVPDVRGSIRTTQEIIDTFMTPCGKYKNHAIVNCGALELPEKELPLPPYTLGAWLGDGTSSSGGITCHPNDAEILREIEKDGFIVNSHKNPNSHCIAGVSGILKKLGLKNNKHIPIEYLRASKAQRLALLQGLCDTDGYCDKGKGSIEFTTTSTALRDGVMELLYSLGIKPSLREAKATMNGRYISQKYRIQFWHNEPCFKLSRKLERQKLSTGQTRNYRAIVSWRYVDPTPMQCISVDSPSRTYLCGPGMVPTHNSYSILGLFILLAWYFPGSKYIVVRRDLEVLKSTTMKSFFEIVPSVITARLPTAYNEWEWRCTNGSVIKFFSENIARDPDLMRFRGLEYDAIAFDELDVTEDTFRKAFERMGTWKMGERSAAKERGEAIPPQVVLATSNPQDGWVKEEIYNKHIDGSINTKWKYIPSRVYDNPHVPESWIQNQRDNMLPDDFLKFIEGDWEIDKNKKKFFTYYDDKLHYSKTDEFEFDHNAETYFSFDFNYDPTTCTVYQVFNTHIIGMRNYGIEGGTRALCEHMLEDAELMAVPRLLWTVTGDTNGTSRSSSAGDVTDYSIIQSAFNLADSQLVNVNSRNKAIVYSRRLCDQFFLKIPFVLDKRMTRLRQDLLIAKPTEKGDGIFKDRKKGYGMDFVDTFRYFVDARFPMGLDDINRFVELAKAYENL